MQKEFVELLEWLLENKKEITMSQVQFTGNFTVGGSSTPLTVTPASASFNLTVGTPADGTVVATVTGGVAPYSYALDAASGSLPTGVTFAEDSNGNITLAGTPTVSGTSSTPVILNITDSASSSTQAKFRPIAVR